MTRDAEKPHFSKMVLDASERAQHLLGKVGAPLVSMVAGSSSPAYWQLQWSKHPELDPDNFEWCEVPGDSEAGQIPRLWKRAAVLGVSTESRRLAWHEAHSYGEKMLQAAVYEADGVVRIGTRLGNRTFWDHEIDNVCTDTIAMRLGRGPLRATMGMWFPDHQELVVPGGVHVVEAVLPIEALDAEYPRTRLV